MARCSQGIKKCVPSGVAYTSVSRVQRNVNVGSELAHLVLHSSEPVEHDCSVTTRNIVNARLEHGGPNCDRY